MLDRGTGADSDPVVLIVDDDETIRRLFQAALRRAGFDTLAAGNGRDALALVADEQVDVVLLDGRMPGMSGLDVLRDLRASAIGKKLPVIFVTGQDELEDRVRGLEAGANDYLTKPVEVAELVARIRAQLRVSASYEAAINDLERRLDAVMLLRRIRRADTAERTATQICAELGRLAGISGSAVLAVRGPRAVVPLAVDGVLDAELVPGTPMSEEVAPEFVDRLRRGPWVHNAALAQRHRDGRPAWLRTSAPIAVAPLDGSRGPLGGLVLAGETSVSGGMLGAAVDFAAVVTALIAADLERQEALDEARAAIRAVIANREFTPHYQPVFDLNSNVVVGYEGLIRWHDGTRPDLRFADASALGLSDEVEEATLRALLDGAQALEPGPWLSLNVSAELIQSGVLATLLHRERSRSIILELTEHEPVDDYRAIESKVRSLHGIRLAIDDAGAGYASLRHILDLRPDLVKLDLSWIRGLDTDRARQALVAGLVDFAKELGCQLVAEGIETEPERDTLRHLGVHFGQGFLLGRPKPAP